MSAEEKTSKEINVNIKKNDVINIIHFNDVYDIETDGDSGGASKFQSFVQKFTSSDIKPIICFSGDFLSPSAIGSVTGGEHMIDIMNNIGITAACMGNHDMDYGNEKAIKVIEKLNFPMLNTNILTPIDDPDDSDNDLDEEKFEDNDLIPVGNALKSFVYKYGDVTIGFLGISEDWTGAVGIKPIYGFVYKEFISECQKYVDLLNKENEIDLMIALTHARLPNDKLLLNKVKGIDVILGGHDHFYHSEQDKETKTVLIKSATDFKNVSWVQLQLNGNTDNNAELTKKIESDLSKSLSDKQEFVGERYKVTQRFYSVDENLSLHDETDKLVARLTEDFNKKKTEVLGNLAYDLDATEDSVRGKEATSGSFISDAIRRMYDTDACLINGGGIRADAVIPAGNITYGTILELVPFPDPVVVIKIKGSTIKKMIEDGIKDLPALSGFFPQMTGIKMMYDPNGEAGKRIKQIWIARNNKDGNDDNDNVFELLKEDDIYEVATSEFLTKQDNVKNDIVETIINAEGGLPMYAILRNFFNGVEVINTTMEKHEAESTAIDDKKEEKEEEKKKLKKKQDRKIKKMMKNYGGLKPEKAESSLLKYEKNMKNGKTVLTVAPIITHSHMTPNEVEESYYKELPQ